MSKTKVFFQFLCSFLLSVAITLFVTLGLNKISAGATYITLLCICLFFAIGYFLLSIKYFVKLLVFVYGQSIDGVITEIQTRCKNQGDGDFYYSTRVKFQYNHNNKTKKSFHFFSNLQYVPLKKDDKIKLKRLGYIAVIDFDWFKKIIKNDIIENIEGKDVKVSYKYKEKLGKTSVERTIEKNNSDDSSN